jgi:hypothetical protein
MFLFLRNTQRAAKRGYAVAASAASLEVSLNNRVPAQTILFRWAGGDREMDVVERDRVNISIPRYDGERDDDCLEGEVAVPAALIVNKDAIVPGAATSAPTLPCGPVRTRRRWSPISTRHIRRRELRRHALGDDCRREVHRTRGQPSIGTEILKSPRV